MEAIVSLLLEFLFSPAQAFTQELADIEAVIEQRIRTNVIWSDGHKFCLQRQGLYGAYKEIVPALIKQSKDPDYKIPLAIPA